MTVSSTTTRNSYAGDGSTTAFSYTFKIFDEDDIAVILRDDTTAVETTQTITTNYTVSGVGNAGGGTITFVTAPPSGKTVVLLRATPLSQLTDYTPNDPFPAESHEDALDKLTFITQELSEEIGRAIKLSKTNEIATAEFTVGATARANKVLGFDGNGDLAVLQEIGIYKGTDTTTTTADYDARDIVKSTTAAQLNNVYIALQDSPTGTLLTNTTYWELLVDAVSAATSATNAANSASAASTSASNAATSETNAATSETNAATSETNAATSATNASNAQTAAETALDTFDDTYLGAKASAPTVDNDGDPLAVGMLYTNSSSGTLFYYNGSAWIGITSGGITDVVDDSTPQLGGNLDVQTNSIVSTSNQDINITPDGTGNVTLGSFTFDADQTVGAGQDNYVLTYDNAGGLISLEASAGGGLADVVDDTTPQLGGDLDVNSNSIVSASNGDIAITPNGTGDVIIDGLKHPQADGTNGQHLATNGSGQLSFQNNYTVDVLVVAGGGGGGGVGAGAGLAGGGGAGGFVEGSIKVHTGEAVSVGVGAGGAGGASGSNVGANGSDSSFGGAFIAFGGGGGSPGRDTNVGGSVGGSGGGGGGGGSGSGTTGGTNEINSLPTQGRSGGTGSTVSSYGGGGGGGARVAGVNGSGTNGGNGGDGIIWKSLGTTYGGGGGGAIVSGTVGSGGAGGGGNGGKRGTAPTAGTANTGGGGGGNGQDDVGGAGANGGSGIVIVRYKSATQLGSGGTVTSSGGYQYHTFTSGGTFTG